MNAHDELERQLRRSVEARRQARAWRPSLATALPLAITLAVIAIVLVVLVSGSSTPPRQVRTASAGAQGRGPGIRPPDPGPAPKNVDASFLSSVENSVSTHDRACAMPEPRIDGKPDSGTPSAGMLSVIPALTQLPPVKSLGENPTLRSGLLTANGVYTRYVRLARRVGEQYYYLVPAARVGFPPASPSAANRCFSDSVAALVARIGEVSQSQRAPTLRYGRAELAVSRYDSETRTVHEGVLLFGLDRGGDGGGGGGLSPSQIERTGELEWTGGPNGLRSIAGVVPAGVARVTLFFNLPGATYSPLVPISGDVVNDVFVIRVPATLRRWRCSSMEWFDAADRSVKSIDESTSGI